jgi:phenol 2-monooxygenase
MQFYKDGFRGGNPDVKPAGPDCRNYAVQEPLPDRVDVLIAGCGPAGLCLAAQLAQFPEIKTMIVEPKPGPIEKGQADGINTRSMEMFQAFGFGETVKRESYWVNQTAFWTPDPDNPAHIHRIGRVQDVPEGSSEMPHTLINQARVHELFLQVMKNAPSRLQPDYSWAVRDLEVDPDSTDHPVIVTLENVGVNAGETRTVRANYVVGCDGARSRVREAIGGTLQGDAAHQAWGVMDILANTDFPDVRQKCLITSATEGNILILPREGGYLFRMYVELDKLNPGERVSARNFTADHLIAAAERILTPYALDVKQVVWWSIYEIGHRLSDRFDDVPEGSDRLPRVFTAGDACHTHSPKAGQGMNVSMQDSFNLGWKLVQVLTGRSDASLLRTYAEERRVEAKRLIETDHQWARIMSAPPGQSRLDAGGMPRFQKQFIENLEFTGGLAVKYDPSILIGEGSYQTLAAGFEIGRRLHSAPVVRIADAMQMQLGHVAEADGRWRIYAFSGRDWGVDSDLFQLCDWLMEDSDSVMRRPLKRGEDIDAVIDLRAIFQQSYDQLLDQQLPAILKPQTGKLGLQDHEKVFCVDHKGAGDIFQMRGVNRDRGCMVVVRPDQYVAHVLPLNRHDLLSAFFDPILLPAIA